MSEPAPIPCRDIVIQRPRLAQALVWVGVAVLVFCLPLFSYYAGFLGAMAALFLSGVSWVVGARLEKRAHRGGTLSLEPERALRIVDGRGTTRRIAFAEIESGYEVPTRNAAVLHLRDGTQITARLTEGSPKRVLDHAGVGAGERVLSLPLRRTLGAFTIGFMSFWPLIIGWSMALRAMIPRLGAPQLPLAFILASVCTALLVVRLGYPRVVIGSDGIGLLGGLRQRFVPYEAIARVSLIQAAYANAAQSVRIFLNDGRSLVLPTIGAPRERLEGIARRMEEAAKAHAAGASRRFEALARGGRSLASWKEDITRMALAPPGFRDQSLEHEDFERILSDAGAPADQRIAAALALRAIDPAVAAPRIRIAAEASADESLREAFTAAAEGEIDDALLDRAAARRAR